MKVEYNSNNSGGEWWLEDEDWHALEAAGWVVDWKAKSGERSLDPGGQRWLGALAISATREGLSLRDAVDEWERVTHKSSTDAGCPCCGQPHSFTEYDDAGKYVRSGPDVKYSADWDDDEAVSR